MALPDFDDLGYLPGGEHEATWQEVRDRFGLNLRRREILDGLEYVLDRLHRRGVIRIWLDGSFVTDKRRPSDVDVVYAVEQGADRGDWPDVGRSRRPYLKQTYRVDLWRFPSPQPMKNAIGHGAQAMMVSIKEYFSSDPDGRPKGIVRLIQEGNGSDQER